MKVQELLTERARTGEKVGHIPVVRMRSKSKFDEKGLGQKLNKTATADANAYPHKTSPNTVVKIARVKNPKQDGHVNLVNIALANDGNPFFPKIYKALLYKGPNENRLYVEMERLHELNDHKLRHTLPFILKSLGVSDRWLKRVEDDFYKDNPHRLISKAIETVVVGDMKDYDRVFSDDINPKFKTAIAELNDYANVKGVGVDLHSGNFMFRLTSTGPQLVIMDPFHDFGGPPSEPSTDFDMGWTG